MDRIVKVDLEKYIIYENKDDKSLVACEMKHQSRLIELYRKNDSFKTVSDDEIIDIYILQLDNKTNSYILNPNIKSTIKINKLVGTIITP